MSQLVTIGISDKLVIFSGLPMDRSQRDAFLDMVNDKLGDAGPIFLFLPGPVDIVDIRAIPPDVHAAADLIREWLEVQLPLHDAIGGIGGRRVGFSERFDRAHREEVEP